MTVVMFLLMTQVASAATTAELQAQIAQLSSQLSGMQTQSGASYTFTRNLKVGSKGADVQKLQQFLMDAGYLKSASATTYFGAKTRAALAAWQRASGISPAAGYFGPATRAMVNASSATPGASTTPVTSYVFTRNLTVGSKGADVQKLQQFLINAGYLNVPTATTYFGAQTKAALMAWQRDNGIPTGTGGFEATTRERMNAAMTAANPVTPSVSYISRPVAAVVGSSVAIKFTSTGSRQANIYLCKTQTDCGTVIGANIAVVAGDNTFTWAVPADVVSGSYTIKVEDVANSNWVVYTDVPLTQPVVAAPTATSTSNATTTPPTQPLIGAISLELPTLAKVGSPLAIKFTSRNVKNVSIVLCADSEHCDINVTSKYASLDGQNAYVWTVPTSITTTRQYFLKIKDADVANAREFKSDLFTITALPVATTVAGPTIVIAQPAASSIGRSLALSYTTKGVSAVDIYFCISQTRCDVSIVKNVTTTDDIHTYAWTIPSATTPGQYYVKITKAGAETPSVMSKTSFAVGFAPGTVCRDIEGPSDILTTCDVSEEAISGRCYDMSLLLPFSVPALKTTIWPTGMGVICAPTGGPMLVKVHCCK